MPGIREEIVHRLITTDGTSDAWPRAGGEMDISSRPARRRIRTERCAAGRSRRAGVSCRLHLGHHARAPPEPHAMSTVTPHLLRSALVAALGSLPLRVRHRGHLGHDRRVAPAVPARQQPARPHRRQRARRHDLRIDWRGQAGRAVRPPPGVPGRRRALLRVGGGLRPRVGLAVARESSASSAASASGRPRSSRRCTSPRSRRPASAAGWSRSASSTSCRASWSPTSRTT